MKRHLLFAGSNLIRFFCLIRKPFAPTPRAPGRSRRIIAASLCAPLLLWGTQASAQQAAPGPEYGYGYGGQNPPSYPPPQYAQPQYAPPQYAQPSQPQYQPPQYAQQPYGQPYGEPYPQQQPGYGPPPPAESEDSAPPPPLSPDQLEQLAAPVALYPDTLLAQILTASTYPAQVAVADQWLKQMQAEGYAAPAQVAAGADAQSWDPSVKALTAFPQVLDMLDQNLQWTTALGNAYFNQPQDLMQTVQVMRQRAEDAGNLESSPQQSVTEDQGQIQVAPPSPEIAYVPEYNPWSAYGQPVDPYPGYSSAGAMDSFLGNGIQFGAGIALSAFEQMPWGWLGWGLSWLANEVLFNHQGYFTNSREVADWGYLHGGPRAYRGWDRGGRGWNRADGWGRGGWDRGGRNGYGTGRGQGSYGGGYNRGGQQAWGRAQPGIRQVQPWNRGGQGLAQRTGPIGGGRQGYSNNDGRGNAYGGEPGRGYASPGYSYGRSSQQAYGGVSPSFGRPQPYARPYGGSQGLARQGYNYGYRGPGSQSFATQPGRSFSGSYRSNAGGPSSGGGRAFADPRSSQPRSGGGLHWFGGGHNNSSFGGGHAPKAYSGGGGHSFFGGGSHSGGGHFGGGGGGHWGGGGHSGGGHSSGSHSSGHSGGGGHHR